MWKFVTVLAKGLIQNAVLTQVKFNPTLHTDIPKRPILIFAIHLCNGFSSDLFIWVIPTKILYDFLTSHKQVTMSCPSHPSQYNHPNNNIWCYSLYRWLVRKRNTSTYQLWYTFPFPSRWFNDLSHVIFLRWLLPGKKSLQTVNLSSTAQTLFTDSSTVKNKDHFYLHQQNQYQYTKNCQTYTETW